MWQVCCSVHDTCFSSPVQTIHPHHVCTFYLSYDKSWTKLPHRQHIWHSSCNSSSSRGNRSSTVAAIMVCFEISRSCHQRQGFGGCCQMASVVNNSCNTKSSIYITISLTKQVMQLLCCKLTVVGCFSLCLLDNLFSLQFHKANFKRNLWNRSSGGQHILTGSKNTGSYASHNANR